MKKKRDKEIIFRAHETEEEITPEQIAEVHEILADILLQMWLKKLKEKGYEETEK